MNEQSNCCYSGVYNPSGEGNEGVCKDCGEHCAIVRTIDVTVLPESGRTQLVRTPLTNNHYSWIPF